MARIHGLTTTLLLTTALAQLMTLVVTGRAWEVLGARAATFARTRARSDRGATLVEYTLMIALIALVCVSAVSVMGRQAGSSITNSGNSMFGP